MAMEKRGVARRGNGEVIGMTVDDSTTICTSCKKIVKGGQVEDGKFCPFCKTEVKFEKK